MKLYTLHYYLIRNERNHIRLHRCAIFGHVLSIVKMLLKIRNTVFVYSPSYFKDGDTGPRITECTIVLSFSNYTENQLGCISDFCVSQNLLESGGKHFMISLS